MRQRMLLLLILCNFVIAKGYSQQCIGSPKLPGSSAASPSGSSSNEPPQCKIPDGDQNDGGDDNGFGFIIYGIGSWDPNLIITPTGFDSARWVSINDKLGISIYFENDPNLATAPVHNAYIYYKLSSKEDAASFRLGSFGFNGMIFTVPNNLNFYQSRLDLRDSLGLFVDVTAGINVTNNTAFWIFQSIDPLTNQPPLDPMTGFLPVKDTSLTALNDTVAPDGEGFVNFTIEPAANSQTRDTIFSQAQIVFDTNDTIATNIEFNTIDAQPPVSYISAGPVIDSTVTLYFNAADDSAGCGVRSYDLYVAEDSLNYILYRQNITDSVIVFTGIGAETYHFFSLATDNVGNRELIKYTPDTSVVLFNSAPVITYNTDTISTLAVAGCGADTLIKCVDVKDAENRVLNYSFTHLPLNGYAAITIDTTVACIKYIADSAFSGIDSCLLTACDPAGKCDSLWFVYYINQALVWYADGDNDSYGTPGNILIDCVQPAGYVSNNSDCDDNNPSINSVLVEICNNGLDDNCNGEIDEGCGGVVLNLRLFIEGFYLNNYTQQPVLFNMGIYNNLTLSDIITVELHDTIAPYSTIITANAIVNINGYALVNLPVSVTGGSYYVAVLHRNSIVTWSKQPVLFNTASVSYDFTQ